MALLRLANYLIRCILCFLSIDDLRYGGTAQREGDSIVKGWRRFINQVRKDFNLWLFCVAFLFLFRIVFILSFKSKIGPEADIRDFMGVFIYGFRFDSMVASYTILLPFLLSLSCQFVDLQQFADRVRNMMGAFFIVVSVILFGVTLKYFREYNDQFNQFLFGFIYDDTEAILITVWKEYHPLLSFMLMGIVFVPTVKIKKRFVDHVFWGEGRLTDFRIPAFLRIFFSFLTVALFVIAIRGSIGNRPVQRSDAAVAKDDFLNKVILNPHIALKYAFKDHKELNNSNGLKVFLPDGDIRAVVKDFFRKEESFSSLDDYMRKVSEGHVNKAARHIFLIVMESYDAWPLMDKYGSLGLTAGLRDLASRGLHFKSFLPASSGTMLSLAPIITGLSDAGVQTNLQKSATRPYSSSIAETFNRLGYKTRFFYGGKLSWRRVGDFTRAQGFKEVYGASHMGMSGVFSGNEWGVDDEYLFDFVEKKVSADVPSFNLILTTTYHPPYDIDLYGKGFPLKEVPEDLKDDFEGTVDLLTLGHLWYADKSIADFVKVMESKLKSPLFAMTGDHSGRKFINSRPDFFERSAVPFILYGKEVLEGISIPDGAAGSHIDIGPTLIGLAAPKGFTYYSLGNDLLEVRPKSLGIGRGKVIGADFIANVEGMPKIYSLPGAELGTELPKLEELKNRHDALHGIAWWLIKNGPFLPSKDQAS